MDWQDTALIVAGLIGSVTAIIHGVLMQRLMVRPLAPLIADDKRFRRSIRILVPALLHYSTVTWFAGGLALIAAALWFDRSARMATGACVAGLYLYGVIVNFWGTRGRHPGWVLYAIALALIAYGLGKPSP